MQDNSETLDQTPDQALLKSTRRGRPPLPPMQTPPPAVSPEDEQALAAAVRINVKADTLSKGVITLQYEAVKTVGQMQAFELVRQFAGTGNLLLFKQVKEAKAYRGMQIPQPDGPLRTLNTFEEFCELMGTSRSKVDEDLLNLAAFGEAFLEASQQMGLGYRDLRKLRALPEDDRALVIESEAVKTNDPETLKDLLEEVAGKNAKLKEEIKSHKADLAARDKVLSSKNKALDDAQTQLAKLKNLDIDAQAALNAEKQRDALTLVANKAGIVLGAAVEYFVALQASLELPDLNPNIREHLEGSSHAVAGGLADMFANNLDWEVDFAKLVYPDWLQQLTPKAKTSEQSE